MTCLMYPLPSPKMWAVSLPRSFLLKIDTNLEHKSEKDQCFTLVANTPSKRQKFEKKVELFALKYYIYIHILQFILA